MVYASPKAEGKATAKLGKDEVTERLEIEQFWETIRNALANPKNQELGERMAARLQETKRSPQDMLLLQRLEREMMAAEKGKPPTLEIRKEEASAFFAYAGSSNREEKIAGMLQLRKDLGKTAEAAEMVQIEAERMSEIQLARITELAEKGKPAKADIEEALGRNRDPKLADAIYTLLARQEAADLALRDALGLEKEDYKKVFGIEAKNQLSAMLTMYRKALGDANFKKAMERLANGETAELAAELKKLGLAERYFFFAGLAPEMMRGGMWNDGALKVLTKALVSISRRSREKHKKIQMEYFSKARKLLSRFADFRGINFAMFSASFLSRLI